MGIHGLTKLLGDAAPGAIKENQLKDHFGRKIAIDASMCLYQFLIAIRTGAGPDGGMLANEAGEITSHLQGMFYRTVRLIEMGIKPCYVFDGKPPTMKSGELAKRKERKAEALENLSKAQEEGDAETVGKMQKRSVTVTREHNEETKKLLRLMGVPVIEAPCEAEAQCAELCKGGKVWATASEDMDALTFGTPILMRHVLYAEARKVPIMEWHIDTILHELQLTMDQFVDLCILLGCDYCDSIRGVGPKRALEFIRKYGSLEKVVKALENDDKYKLPESFPVEEARKLFVHPEVLPADSVDLKWNDPDEAALKQFLVAEKGFSEARVDSALVKLKAQRGKATQGRLDSFFTSSPSTSSPSAKRKADDGKAGAGKKVKALPAKGKGKK